MAWDNRPWILDGAAVRVAMIGFDNGSEKQRLFNGLPTLAISADLKSDVDLTQASRLQENKDIAFIGGMKKGSFDISDNIANMMINSPRNPNGRPNTDVIHPWVNGLDITRRPRKMWIIDFGITMSEDDASLYELPFEYVRTHVKPERDKVRNQLERERWWLHGRSAPDLRAAIQNLQRYVATTRVAKYRIFTYINKGTLPDGALVIFARADDYFLGILQARPHELWSLRMGTSLEDRPRYSQSFTFETFPFPWAPGQEPQSDPRVEAIAAAAHRLVELRDNWLNPPGADAAELKKRTLTNLYNQRPAWLDMAHKKLDAAVFAAYGWPADLTDEQILERLLALNLERAVAQGGGVAVSDDDVV